MDDLLLLLSAFSFFLLFSFLLSVGFSCLSFSVSILSLFLLFLDPTTLSSTTRGGGLRTFRLRATGSCWEHQEPSNGNGSCPLDRDKGMISPLVSLACLYFVFLCNRGTAFDWDSGSKRILWRASRGKATSERMDETRRRNHWIGISYDIKVALLVSERRSVCRIRRKPVMSLRRGRLVLDG